MLATNAQNAQEKGEEKDKLGQERVVSKGGTAQEKGGESFFQRSAEDSKRRSGKIGKLLQKQSLHDELRRRQAFMHTEKKRRLELFKARVIKRGLRSRLFASDDSSDESDKSGDSDSDSDSDKRKKSSSGKQNLMQVVSSNAHYKLVQASQRKFVESIDGLMGLTTTWWRGFNHWRLAAPT